MTLQIFTILLAILCIASTGITEAIKRATKEKISNNLLAAIVAVVVGGGGTVAAFLFMSIPFTAINIVCIVLMVIAIWVGSMIGYDKVKQLVKQIIEQLH